MVQNTTGTDQRLELQRKAASGRSNLLLVLLFTLINLVLLVTMSDRYFLFSASVPYYLTGFGMLWDGVWDGMGISTYTITALVLSALILGLYLLCWLMGKKHVGWYIAAMVLFALDTVFLVWMEIDYLGECLLDLAFHIWVIVGLVQAYINQKKLSALPQEVPQLPEA